MNLKDTNFNLKIHKECIGKIENIQKEEKKYFEYQIEQIKNDDDYMYSINNFNLYQKHIEDRIKFTIEQYSYGLKYYNLEENFKKIFDNVIKIFKTEKNNIKEDKIYIEKKIEDENYVMNIKCEIFKDLKSAIKIEIEHNKPEQILPISFFNTGLVDKQYYEIIIKENKFEKKLNIEIKDIKYRITDEIDYFKKKKINKKKAEISLSENNTLSELIILNEEKIINYFYNFYYNNFLDINKKNIDLEKLYISHLSELVLVKTIINEKKIIEEKLEDRVHQNNFRNLLELEALKNDNYENLFLNNLFMKILVQNESLNTIKIKEKNKV